MRPAKRGRPKGKTKVKVLISLDKSIYKKSKSKGYNLSKLINNLLTLYFMNNEKFSFKSDRLVSGRPRVQIPPGAYLNKILRLLNRKWG